MLKLRKAALNEVKNWLLWLDSHLVPIPEADEAFQNEINSPATISESEFYIVFDEVKDAEPKNLLLLKVNTKNDHLTIRFSRIFHEDEGFDHYEDAHRWFRTALTEFLSTTKAKIIFIGSKNKEIFERMTVDIQKRGFISSKDFSKAIFKVGVVERFGASLHIVEP